MVYGPAWLCFIKPSPARHAVEHVVAEGEVGLLRQALDAPRRQHHLQQRPQLVRAAQQRERLPQHRPAKSTIEIDMVDPKDLAAPFDIMVMQFDLWFTCMCLERVSSYCALQMGLLHR